MILSINMEGTGNRIKELINDAGYSIKELQKAMTPISRQAIYKWQQGKTLPTIDNLMILSKLLSVPIEQIIVTE